MLYDAYENRILKIARVLDFIRKHILILSIALVLVVSATVTLLATKGLAGKTTCPDEVSYGDPLSFEANAFLSSVSFEFRTGNGEWSDTQPYIPGQYTVRSVGRSITGKPRYGAERTFTITRRTLDVQTNDTSVIYGEFPHIAPTLPYGDTLYCENFFFDDILQISTDVTPDENSVYILSQNGVDVTHFYTLRMVNTPITIKPRPLGVTVKTATHTYDNQKFSYDTYEITSGSLVYKDTLIATFDQWLINAGEAKNQPTLRVFNTKGRDVTHHYDITETIGNLVVEKRPLVITTLSSVPVTYDGKEHSQPFFTLSPDTPLVPGHRLEIDTPASFINAGVHDNTILFRVVDNYGNTYTDNYSFTLICGKIQIDPRPISVNTHSKDWVYDGTEHTHPSATVSGLLFEHSHMIENAVGIIDAGSRLNELTVRILDGETDITENYIPTYTYGKLLVTKRPVALKSADVEHIYDGLSAVGGELVVAESSPYPLVDGHLASGTIIGSRIDVGVGTTQVQSAKISDGTRDVTQNYKITTLPGKITITPRPICIVLTDAKKTYDGTPLTSSAFTVEAVPPLSFALVQGHQVSNVKTSGSQTEVGTGKNTFVSCCVFEGTRDVTFNYAPQGKTGKLTVEPRPITVYSGSAEKVYDGTPLVCHDAIKIKEGSLVLDHRLDMKAVGQRIEIGTSKNTIEGTVRDGKKQDVGKNYTISYDYGQLTVLHPATILVTTGSAEAPYTGNPLTCSTNSYTFLSGKLAPGHKIELKNTGSQTEIGTSLNTYTISITYNGKDVSAQYDIKENLGKLTVYDSTPPAPSPDPKLDESGNLKKPAGDAMDGNTIILRIKTDKSGKVYLRLMNFGDFKGQSFAQATTYSKLLDNAYCYNYLTGIALQNASIAPSAIQIQSFTTQYLLPYYLGLGPANYDLQTSDVYYSGEGMSEYSLHYYVYDGTGADLSNKLGTYSSAERAYRQFVHQNYLTPADSATSAVLKEIIAREGFDPADPQVITRVADYLKQMAVYSENYNNAIDEADNAVLAFLEYKEGVCRHFAATGTLLFRELGIPARYTIGYASEAKAGTWVNVSGLNAHAWVEVYIDGVGWIPVEVTGGGNGDSPIDKEEKVIQISPTYQSKPYDGTPLYAQNEIDMSPLLSQLKKQNYYFDVQVIGEQTEVGRGTSFITSFVLYDPSGKDVTSEYTIICETGTLEVFPSNIKVINVYLYQLQKYYDGTPLAYEDGDFDVLNLENGLDFTLKLHISLSKIGYLKLHDINIDFAQYAEYQVKHNGIDVTELYRVVFVLPEGAPDHYVPIRIDPRPLELTAKSAEKNFDGTPLKSPGVTISMGTLLSGHYLEQVSVRGEALQVGESICTIENVIIRDREGNNVTGNYQIICKPGTLTVLDPNP